jgi:hypothetical protein
MSRPIIEPGGALLIGVGLSDAALQETAAALYPTCSSLSILIAPAHQRLELEADEVWVYGPLGLRGALALIRRMSWRHFECVYQPRAAGLPYLRYFIWPRPDWRAL